MAARITLTAISDQNLVASEVSSQRIIEWVVEAAEQPKAAARAPLNIALVIDRSGSMHGEKLHYVQQAACHVLDLLGPGDRAAIIAYDDTITTIAPSTLVTPSAKKAMQHDIMQLRPGGSTNLSGGWLEGCRLIAEQLQAENITRALLLTDGLANAGIVDVEELSVHARELRKRGVATSTFGVGLDFNEQLLELLAEQGGGHFYFIERPQQIPEVFRSELGELLTITAREATLSIGTPRGVAVEIMGGLPHERSAERLRVFLGDMCAGERRMIYTRVTTPTDSVGTSVVIGGELGYADLSGKHQHLATSVAFSYQADAIVQQAGVREDLLARAAEVELAAAAREALRLEREGQREQAQAVMQASLAAAPAMPAPTAAAYQDLASQLGQGMKEEQRKQAHFSAYKKRQNRS